LSAIATKGSRRQLAA